MSDITILFYTANKIPQYILNLVIEHLKSFKLPIVSVSQKSIDLGNNIVVPKEYSVRNIHKQILIGAKEIKTKYVALCEDDCFYLPEHFFIYRPKYFAYNRNRWTLHLKRGYYSYRFRAVMSQLIANRDTLISSAEERLSLPDDPILNKIKYGEYGKTEKELGIREYNFEKFRTKTPNLVIGHKYGIYGDKRPKFSTICDYVEGLGYSKDWITLLDYWRTK